MKSERDVEKSYSTKQFIEKLRRLADALESGKNLRSISPANASMSLSGLNARSSMNAMAAMKKLNSRSHGKINYNSSAGDYGLCSI